MPAPKGNKYNLKKPENRQNIEVKVWCTTNEKNAWDKARQNKKMSAWARENLNNTIESN